MAFSFTHQNAFEKSSTSLSKLTKGIGEFFDEEKRVEIFLDEKVNFFNFSINKQK
jgi:hypothetical protein